MEYINKMKPSKYLKPSLIHSDNLWISSSLKWLNNIKNKKRIFDMSSSNNYKKLLLNMLKVMAQNHHHWEISQQEKVHYLHSLYTHSKQWVRQ
jgi:hypothetical protein